MRKRTRELTLRVVDDEYVISLTETNGKEVTTIEKTLSRFYMERYTGAIVTKTLTEMISDMLEGEEDDI